MSIFPRFRALLLVACLCSSPALAQLWTTAYYPGDSESVLPPAEIDFHAVTHLIYFAAVPRPDGGLDLGANNVSRSCAGQLITRAHEAGSKVLICVGGADTGQLFQRSASAAHRGAFVSNLVALVKNWNYDGVDVDWEPLPQSDFAEYAGLVRDLRAALSREGTNKLLTAAASAYPIYGDPPRSEYQMFASLQERFDQINIMTYDLSGAYFGWVSWFNSPLYDGGSRFASTGGLLPSLDGAVRGFVDARVAPAKLGIGIPFYGDLWAGSVNGPRQPWKLAPVVKQLSYAEIMAGYFQTNRYHWDTNAEAAYLSLAPGESKQDAFVSYDDEKACEAKVRYAREHHLGGVMIWHLAHGHLAGLAPGRRDPLLQAIIRASTEPVAPKETAIIKPAPYESN